MPFERSSRVQHARFGQGTVRFDEGDTVLVSFDHGIESCTPDALVPLSDLMSQAAERRFDPALPVVTRVLGSCIQSVNDVWGVFSRSRVALLPHQLWVCKQVQQQWPTRFLIADDVGLGKTVEAGLILTPLLARRTVQRLLILTPATLVEQWQYRLREQFDIRLSIYRPEADTPKTDFWNTHDRVVASAHTLRLDHSGRWKRLLSAKAWDMVMVDEAHHLYAAETGERTLALKLMDALQSHQRIQSLILFTGTPHRGKDYAFLSLLKLLKPKDFDPHRPLEWQLPLLKSCMIRNNKQNATNLKGEKLFTPVRSRIEKFQFSAAEARFYEQMTEFILTGKAYAAGMQQLQRRTVNFVLNAMQKLASSSIAAVKRALERRLQKLQAAQHRIQPFEPKLADLERLQEEGDPSTLDEQARLEEELLENLGDILHLNPQEIPALQELLQAASAVNRETKIDKILSVVSQYAPNDSILFFTEYKSTQALLLAALMEKYGEDSVTFINGDGYLEQIRDAHGRTRKRTSSREQAANQFNAGTTRFLISTEAAGEGIDLQEHCHLLFHVDLPWNPMRLHQRVGRLSRYGQKEPVEVVIIRNPTTHENKIWALLEQKLDRISLAFSASMDDPEDMRQLVLGMASPQTFTQLFGDADAGMSDEKLSTWFDEKTATFGGEDILQTVRKIYGSVARFDFGTVVKEIPPLDIPDLQPFFKSMLAGYGCRPQKLDDFRLSFKTPSEITGEVIGIADRYNLLFSRAQKPAEDDDIMGVGFRLMDRVLALAMDQKEQLACLAGLENPLVVFRVTERVTSSQHGARPILVGICLKGEDGTTLLRDWELLHMLNGWANRPRSPLLSAQLQEGLNPLEIVREAMAALPSHLSGLDLPFAVPQHTLLACILPGASRAHARDEEL